MLGVLSCCIIFCLVMILVMIMVENPWFIFFIAVVGVTVWCIFKANE